MKKKLLLTFLAVVFAFSLCFGIVTVSADEANAFDGQTNLATDASAWVKCSKTSADWFTIGEGGIEINQYGSGSAATSLALKELLPYEGKAEITFNSVQSTSGFFKVVFADNSGSVNGLAMKPWEISGSAEHVAVEIQSSGIALWHYNPGNSWADGKSTTLAINSSAANYIDGNDHVLKVEYKAEKNAYVLKVTIDETVHFDGSIATSNLYTNNVLTLGGYGNSLVEDALTVKAVKVTRLADDPAKEIDENNLLGKADKWTIDDGATLDATTATLTATSFDGKIVLNDKLSAETLISTKLELLNAPATDNHKSMLKIKVLGNDEEEVLLQIDADGNCWLKHKKIGSTDENIAVQGEWVPAIIQGLNSLSITITPELTDGDEDIFVKVNAAGKIFGLAVQNLDLIPTAKLEISGGEVGGFTFTEIMVEDLIKEKADSAVVTTDLLKGSEWKYVSSKLSADKIELGGQDYLRYEKALPVEGEISFTIKGTAKCNTYYYLGFGNFLSTLWDGEEVTEAQNRFRITTTGSTGFYTIGLSDGTAVAKKSGDTTMLFDGTNQTFTWKTEKVEGGLKVTLLRNGEEEFSNIYANDTAIGSSQGFYLMFRATGTHEESPIITDVTSSVEEKIDVEDYNRLIGVKRAIYALDMPTEANAATVKEDALKLIGALTDADREVVTNELYAEHIIAKANKMLQTAADKAAAKAVSDEIETLKTDYATITADNAADAKDALRTVKAAYDALTDAQKAYVTNYGEIETVEIAINDYEEKTRVEADKAAAKAVSDRIAALDSAYATITADNVAAAKQEISAIKEAYEALTDAQKAYVTGYEKVSAKETAITEFENASTTSSGEQPAPSDNGCSGAIASSAFAVVMAIIASAVVFKKKENR